MLLLKLEPNKGSTVFQELRVPSNEGASWQERVRTFAFAYRALKAHPNLTYHLITYAESGADATLTQVKPFMRHLWHQDSRHMMFYEAQISSWITSTASRSPSWTV